MMSSVLLSQWLAHRPRRGSAGIEMVVLHATSHTAVDPLLSELRHLDHSYHYVVEPNGTVHECVPYGAVAFHAGNSYGPQEALRGISRDRDAHHHFVELTSVNEYSIGICLLSHDNPGRPPCQLTACQDVLRGLKAKVPRLRYVTTHSRVAPGQAAELNGVDVPRLAADVGLAVWDLEA